MAKTLIKHPLYSELEPTWRIAKDVYEGLGGFLDPARPYLVPHPREWLDHSVKQESGGIATMVPNPSPRLPSPKLQMRRRLARYENIAEAILAQMGGALFLHPPTRTFAKPNDKVSAWLDDVDGRGLSLSDAVRLAWTSAGVFGHGIVTMDKPAKEAQTQADAAAPRMAFYTPLDMPDWLDGEDRHLTAVKLLEPAPRVSFDQRVKTTDYRVRIITETDWTLSDAAGKQIDKAAHGFGALPVTIFYAKRRPFAPPLGKSLIGDPQLHLDLYNLVSEVRELLRNQTFGILNVPVGEKGNVSNEQALLGQQSGTANVMFSTLAAQYLSPDGTNVTVYHEHMDRLVRMIYRLASAPWESDSREAESAEARGRKREDQHHILSAMAAECQRLEMWALEMVYRGLYGADRWQAQWETDQPSVSYPPTFEQPDWQALAKDVAESIALDLGPTATKELKKRFVSARLRDASPEVLEQAATEIDAQTILTEDEKREQMLKDATSRLAEVA